MVESFFLDRASPWSLFLLLLSSVQSVNCLHWYFPDGKVWKGENERVYHRTKSLSHGERERITANYGERAYYC